MNKRLSTLIISILFYVATCAQSNMLFDNLLEQSKQANKPIFLLFSGSDWCSNCIRFEKYILRDSTFQSYLHEYFLYYQADFPQRKKQSSVEKNQNEALAEKYNPTGIFPNILIISPTMQSITIDYKNDSVEDFIAKLSVIKKWANVKNGTQN
ncbi:MAG TPA: thioredoxin family protein [Chitinophagales bacterium]|nr:thioredoxin family protein [Chitinophagales bacterium]HMW12482.1 thioredoxin family protein [Chitinophagales bacterium]HMX60008.1 thioredoxin family protein [Chitinophagales bacterium]HMY22977.1 thioredoxin family protein [Chitinophagales bacterium]HMZ33826.1 thioredoxin family protein [Chitinophagales bacterium]